MTRNAGRDWQALHQKIGPLRYQLSESDCVPTTTINALLVVRQERLKAPLIDLIWSVSLDLGKRGTGYVSSQLLSHVIQAWSAHAGDDRYERQPLTLHSEILAGKAVNLTRQSALTRCLGAGGVACITTQNGGHYALLIAKEGDDYLGFDPWWRRAYATPRHQAAFAPYHALVNVRWSRQALAQELAKANNQWVHLIRAVST